MCIRDSLQGQDWAGIPGWHGQLPTRDAMCSKADCARKSTYPLAQNHGPRTALDAASKSTPSSLASW
eukprot:13818326-Alexandrium_andersonii.AAC.1